MEEIILKVEGLSKQYRLGNVGTGSLADDFKRFAYKLRGKEDPFLKIGETNDRSKKGSSDYVWALKDINFEVKKGEVLGIIGRNGAGKSTLLKILSKVTGPTQGAIKYNGKIASLLEVGTGFHGEMTGRENVFLNGAILGMTKKEIDGKIEEIIAFSGCDRYIDTPVKRYSSGMTVRLAFAVAAFLEPDILIIDEVLAVGDVEFQKKAIGKMKDISNSGGRTVLFVSHNMAAVKNLCTRAIILENGKGVFNGPVDKAIAYYLNGPSINNSNNKKFTEIKNDTFKLEQISICEKSMNQTQFLNEYHEIEINTDVYIKKDASRLHLTYLLKGEDGSDLFTFTHAQSKIKLKEGKNYLTCFFPKGFLNIGRYYLSFYLIEDAKRTVYHEPDIMIFSIQEGQREVGAWLGKEPGVIKPIFKWTNQ